MARPFLATIPAKVMEDEDLRPFFEYLIRYLQGTERTATTFVGGDPNDPFGDLAPSLDSDEGFGDAGFVVDSVDQFRTFELAGGTYTAINNDYILASRSVQITDPNNPSSGARFRVKNVDGSDVAVSFTNSSSDNGPAVGIARAGTVLDFSYNSVSKSWSIT